MRNEKIQLAYARLGTLEKILEKELKNIQGNKSNLDKVVPDEFKGKFSSKENLAKRFGYELKEEWYNSSVISLFAVFEQEAFEQYRHGAGTIEKVISEKTPAEMPFYKSRTRFVSANIDKIHGIIALLEGYLPAELHEKLKLIKELRDFNAHGQRFGTPPSSDIPVKEIAQILDSILSFIKGSNLPA